MNQVIGIHKCRRCKHQWANRKKRMPKACPKCKSVNWNEKKED